MDHEKINRGMVVTRTPFRISFFGGGTDFEDYFNQRKGMVIGAAIDKYLYVTVNSLERILEKRIRLSYSKLENVEDAQELEHEIARTLLTYHPCLNGNNFLDIHTFADLPNSSGIGSSSAFTAGMLNALYLLNGVYKTPEQIAKEAILIERKYLGHQGGWQDQILSTYGGLNKVEFSDSSFYVEPICLSHEKMSALQACCHLFFTGQTRSSSETHKKLESTSTEDRWTQLDKIYKTAQQAFDALIHTKTAEDMVYALGLLLHETWLAKRRLGANVSNAAIDEMYEKALSSGALGGKICGAGGGGFLLVIAPPEKKETLLEAMKNYRCIHFNFDVLGSKLIYGCNL